MTEKIQSFVSKLKNNKAYAKKVLISVMLCTFMLSMIGVSADDGTTPEGLATVESVVDFLFKLIGTVVTTIISTPILLLPVGIFVAGAGIGLAKRFIGR